MNEHQIPLETLFAKVESSPQGLSSEEAQKRLKTLGANVLESAKRRSWLFKYLQQFTNFFALLLIVGSALTFLANSLRPAEGHLYMGVALLAVVFLNATFTFIQQYQSEKILESFKKMLPLTANVLRDGESRELTAEQIVPGDILLLNEGDKIPADGRLVEEHSLRVDNSAITGESEPKLRKLTCTHPNILESRNMVFSGTLVQSGRGKALIYATGMNTQIGGIVKLTKETETGLTPLGMELRRFIKIISTIAIILGVIFFTLSFFIEHHPMASLIFAIGIIVANVPEGLLPTVTLSLTLASKRMAKKKALIKNLESVETLGSTTVICTDKTGTLTQNEMAVETVYLNLKEQNIFEKGLEKSLGLPVLFRIMGLCNNAHFDKLNRHFRGDPTETALLNFVVRYPQAKDFSEAYPRLHESPFDSQTKRMMTLNQVADKKIAHLKGAPEVVLQMCNRILLQDQATTLSEEQKQQVLHDYERLASRGERVLGFAYQETTNEQVSDQEYIFVALAGLLDPHRPEVPKAIQKCKSAGIRVLMITGDYSLTAEALARKVGLISHYEEPSIITGEELEQITPDRLAGILNNENALFARTTPQHKLKIVKMLQALGEVVTVTGDGVNDAPALKNADMGVAMGLAGTEVAREASDMVLMDDNFATIVNAIEEGRTIFENIKKFIGYILTSNIPEILPFIAFVLFRIPLPLTVILILAIDLGTDLLPALGLGMESPEDDVMKRKPRPRSERLLSFRLLFKSYGIVGMVEAAAGFFTFFYILRHGGWHWGQDLAPNNLLYLKAVSGFFASIILCQIANVMVCRTRRESIFKAGLFKNHLVVAGIITEILLLALMFYPSPSQKFFGTQALSFWVYLLPLPFALLIFAGEELRKFAIRKKNAFALKYLVW